MDGETTQATGPELAPLPATSRPPVPSSTGMMEPRQASYAPPTPPAPLPAGIGPVNPQGKGAQRVARRELERSAIQLRKAGASYEQIATTLKVAPMKAFNAVQRALRRVATEYRQDAEDVRALELERLDAMQMKLWQQLTATGDAAMAPELVQGAVSQILRIQERRAKYLGLDKAPPSPASVAAREAESKMLPTLKGATLEELKILRDVVRTAKERRDHAEAAAKAGTGTLAG